MKSLNTKGLKKLTLTQMLELSAKTYADQICMYYHKVDKFVGLSYREIDLKSKAFARGLIELGVEKGDRIAVLSENRPEWGISYFGILLAGGIVLPLDPCLKISELKHIIREAKAKLVVTSVKFISDLEEISNSLTFLQKIICMDDIPQKSSVPFSQLLKVRVESEKGVFHPETDEVASVIYTSGTTGSSKGVVLTHKNIISCIWGLQKRIDFDSSDNFLSVLPLHHAFECTCGFLTPISRGAKITFARSLKSKEILEDIKNSEATIMLGVPLLFEKMLSGIFKAVKRRPFFVRALFKANLGVVKFLKKAFGINFGKALFKWLRKKAGLSSLRLFFCGGAPLDPKVAQGFDLLGIKFLQGYGLTETSPVLTVNPQKNPKHESVGLPIPGVELKILNPDKKGIGEIAARGDVVMEGYYNNEKATSEVFKDGWFLTGDSGWVDRNGYYYVVGRLKNVIVTRAGKNVYPEELENELNKSPFILESLVLGRPTPGGKGEEPYAIIVPDYDYFDQVAEKDGVVFDEEKIEMTIKSEIVECCSNIADYKRIKGFKIREEEFEKTTTKKIKRYLYEHKVVRVSTD